MRRTAGRRAGAPAGSRARAVAQVVDQRAELAQAPPLALRVRRRAEFGREDRREQALVPRGRDLGQLRQRGLADAALRRGHRADEGRIVVVVGDQAQVGDDVLDLGAVEERLPAGDRVRHVLRAQRLLEHAGLVVAAIQDRVVAEAAAVLELVREQPRDDRARPRPRRRPTGSHPDRVAVAEVAPQPLLEQLGVVARSARWPRFRMRTVER